MTPMNYYNLIISNNKLFYNTTAFLIAYVYLLAHLNIFNGIVLAFLLFVFHVWNMICFEVILRNNLLEK